MSLLYHLDAIHCIHRTDVPANSATTTKAAHQPVYLRSYKIPAARSTHQQRVAQVLSELGLRHDRLVMPTHENCAALEQLLSAASALVETKKVVDRVDQEIRILQARLNEREGGTAEGDEGAGVDGGADNAGMDVDDIDGGEDLDADADGETDRAVSQAPSTRSTGRKRVNSRIDLYDIPVLTIPCQIKRSGSVSSIGSNTTTATRATSRRRNRT